jgi:23S rRNA pseudouridine1911/1915/1917 synthase
VNERPEPIAVVAGPGDAGQRTDRFLAEAIAALSMAGATDTHGSIGTMSRTRVKSLIVEGAVSRDGAVLRNPADPVRAGSCFVVQPPAVVPARPEAQAIPFAILYEDRDIIVLDKPAGLVVHPAPGNEDGTLVNALLAHCGDSLPGIGGERRPGIVHRLDKDTSGVMVVAKTEQSLASLSASFAARDLDRQYVALVWGVPSPGAGDVEGAIGRDPNERKRMAIVSHGGKPALTHYRTTRVWMPSVSELAVKLATGRTHQIRVHMASIGHPLLGDPSYLRRIPGAAKGLPPALRGMLLDFPRQALHAARLGFAHPRTGEALMFETTVPPDMLRLIDALNQSQLPELQRT